MRRHLILGIITLLSAGGLASTAAYFSISGLASLFAAAFLPVVIMGSILEVGKIIATAWLHQNWTTAPKMIKYYLTTAIVVLMLVTSMGIFGFLSKGHLEQEIPIAQIELKIERFEQQIQIKTNSIDRDQDRLMQLDGIIQTLIEYSKISGKDGARAVRLNQKSERDLLNLSIQKSFEHIDKLQDDLSILKQTSSGVVAKLGPIKFVAALYNDWFTDGSVENKIDTGSAVRFVIFMIMFAFDPVAIVLVLAGLISLSRVESFSNRERELQQAEEREVLVLDEYEEYIASEKIREKRIGEVEASLKNARRKSANLVEEKRLLIADVEEAKELAKETKKQGKFDLVDQEEELRDQFKITIDKEKDEVKKQLHGEWEEKRESLRQEVRAELVAEQIANAERMKKEAAQIVAEEAIETKPKLSKMLSDLDDKEQETLVNNLTDDERNNLKDALVKEIVEDTTTPVSGRGLRPRIDGNRQETKQEHAEGSTNSSSTVQKEINLDLINLIRDNPKLLDEMRDKLSGADIAELEKIVVGGKKVIADDLKPRDNSWISPPHLLKPTKKK